MLVDTHCHLDQIEDLPASLEEAGIRQVTRIVAVTEDLETMKRAKEIEAQFPDRVFLGLGLHPVPLLSLTEEEEKATLSFLTAQIESASVVGEVGLDFKHATSDEEKRRQLRCLRSQCQLAAAAGKPINLHSRRSERAVMNEAIAFHEDTGLNAQLHWFTHSRKLVRITNEKGIFVSAGPSVLHDEASCRVALEVRPDLLLLETDGPVPFGGVSARPSWVRDVAEHLAQARGESWEELASRTSENFLRYLGDRSAVSSKAPDEPPTEAS